MQTQQSFYYNLLLKENNCTLSYADNTYFNLCIYNTRFQSSNIKWATTAYHSATKSLLIANIFVLLKII